VTDDKLYVNSNESSRDIPEIDVQSGDQRPLGVIGAKRIALG